MINLIIKGSFDDAIINANRRGVIIGNLRNIPPWRETLATCDDSYLPAVVKWYAADLNLLLYSQKE